MHFEIGKGLVLMIFSSPFLCACGVWSSFNVNESFYQDISKYWWKCPLLLQTWKAFTKSSTAPRRNVLKLSCAHCALPCPSFFDLLKGKGWKECKMNWSCIKSTLPKMTSNVVLAYSAIGSVRVGWSLASIVMKHLAESMMLLFWKSRSCF